MATRTSIASGLWSVAGTWDTGVPVNGDSVIITNTFDVEFDVDQSGMADGITLTINSGGTLHASTTVGTYYLKTSAAITLNGIFRAGTSVAVPYPSGCTFTISFNSTANSIECGISGKIYFYCLEPTNKYIKLSTIEAIGQTELSVDTDITADIWADGNSVRINDVGTSGMPESEARVIDTGGISADHVDITVGLTAAKAQYAYVVLITRNIKITGTTDYAIRFNTVATGSYIAAEISGCTYGVVYGTSHTISGTISGCTYGVNSGTSHTVSGTISGCTNGVYTGTSHTISGTISGCTYGVVYGDNYFLVSATLNNTNELRYIYSGVANNTILTGTEFSGYNSSDYRSKKSYFESFNHDQVSNAFKAWCVGGIVTSQVTSPPTGYTIWYEHACESASYPVFRQYKATVLAGEVIEVVGKIRIADGEDLSSNPPALQIIDYFADPLFNPVNEPLDECEIPEPNGGVENDWQDVSVIWANQGNSPRQVLVRMIAQHATADVDEVWSVADYKTQIQDIHKKIKRLGPTGQS